jgi:rRNA-processing protein FCF1
MQIKVAVEIYSAYGRKTVDVVIDEAALRELAEEKVRASYACDSCAAQSIQLVVEV